MHLPQRRHQIHISYNAICYHCSAMVRYLRRISRFLERFKANYSLVAPSNSGNRGCWGEAWLRRSSWDLFVVDGDETHSYITVIVFPRMIKWQCWISWAWLEDWTWASNPELHWSQNPVCAILVYCRKTTSRPKWNQHEMVYWLQFLLHEITDIKEPCRKLFIVYCLIIWGYIQTGFWRFSWKTIGDALKNDTPKTYM